MSSYKCKVKIKKTGEIKDVYAHDNYFGQHQYGYADGERVYTEDEIEEITALKIKDNMREIKFRAWDKVNKEMVLNDSFYELQKWNRTEKELEDFELMQYTGLKDKNGKEIYEGDVVKSSSGSKNIIGVVKYRFQNMPKFVLYDTEGKFLSDILDHMDDAHCLFEVIGNIYEHSRLLKDK